MLKTDSYALESNVHFPTDYNLLWDGTRKSLELVKRLQGRHRFLKAGWRKWRDWYKRLKKRVPASGPDQCPGRPE